MSRSRFPPVIHSWDMQYSRQPISDFIESNKIPPTPARTKTIYLSSAIKKILGPAHTKTFARDYFSRRPLFIKSSSHLLKLLSNSDLDNQDIFRKGFFPYHSYHLINSNNQSLSAEHARRILAAGTLKDLVEKQKGSIRIVNVQTGSVFWSRLVKEFHDSFGGSVFANAYLTPARGQTFLRHWDDHDIFVLQVSGTKTWEISQPITDIFPETSVNCGPSKKVMQVTLQPGSLLYVPRGFPHLAKALDQQSLHITIGISGAQKLELLKMMLEQVLNKAEKDPFFNEPLFHVFNRQMKNVKSISSQIYKQLDSYLSSNDVKTLIEMSEHKKNSSYPNYSSVGEDDAVQLDRRSFFQLNSKNHIAVYNNRLQSHIILLNKRRMSLPRHYSSAFQLLIKRKKINMADLKKTNLTTKDSIYFLKSLIEFGLISRSPFQKI
jgi:hypothetical protein